MTKEVIFQRFKEMFPVFAAQVKTYKKIGSKTISMRMRDGNSFTFLFVNSRNWNFGTKPWRQKPDPIPKKVSAGVRSTEASEVLDDISDEMRSLSLTENL